MELSTAEELYVNALFELTSAICIGDEEIAMLEQRATSTGDADDADAYYTAKAAAIQLYTQQFLRGGLN